MIGSLAYAHPAAEWPAVAVALDAELTLSGPEGERTVSAAGFFNGPFATTRRRQELLTEAGLPLLDENSGVGFAEQRRTHASFAMAAAVATLTVEVLGTRGRQVIRSPRAARLAPCHANRTLC